MLRSVLVVAVVGLLGLTPGLARAATAPDCDLPNILILLDVSGSMVKDGSPKYSQAKAGLLAAVKSFEGQANFGLMVYPRPDETGHAYGYCNITDTASVGFSTSGTETAFTSWLDAHGTPKGSYDTPIFQALFKGGKLPELAAGKRNYILLITDGAQDCCNSGDYDNNKPVYGDYGLHKNDCSNIAADILEPHEAEKNRFNIVNLVQGLRVADNHVTTYAIGFSAQSDANLLNRIAVASDTLRAPDCDPTIVDPTSADNCYFTANDSSTLNAALATIVGRIGSTVEVCDGFDNDCDHKIDNIVGSGAPLTQPCSNECGGGNQTCIAETGSGIPKWTTCDAPLPKPETCNGLDDDCDGHTDNVPGSTEILSLSCDSCKAPGKKVCNGHEYGICSTPPVSLADCSPSNASTPPPPAPAPKPEAAETPAPQEQPTPPIPLKQRRLVKDGCACHSTAPDLAGSALLALCVAFALRRRKESPRI
jgi:MYXO-CTERM domain-containing protein